MEAARRRRAAAARRAERLPFEQHAALLVEHRAVGRRRAREAAAAPGTRDAHRESRRSSTCDAA